MKPSRSPWIGPRFDGTVVILESAYKNTKPGRSITETGWKDIPVDGPAYLKQLVRLQFRYRDPVFARVAKAFGEDFDSLWKRVAFFNFVPELIHGSRGRPTKSQLRAGRDHFWPVIKLIERKAHRRVRSVVLFSKTCWPRLPEADPQPGGRDVIRRMGYELCSYRNAALWCACLPHPRARGRVVLDMRIAKRAIRELYERSREAPTAHSVPMER